MVLLFTHITKLEILKKILQEENGFCTMRCPTTTGIRNHGGFEDYIYFSGINTKKLENIEGYEEKEYYTEVFESEDDVMIILKQSVFNNMNECLYAENWHAPFEEHLTLTLDTLDNIEDEFYQIIVKNELKFKKEDIVAICYCGFYFKFVNEVINMNLPCIDFENFMKIIKCLN